MESFILMLQFCKYKNKLCIKQVTNGKNYVTI